MFNYRLMMVIFCLFWFEIHAFCALPLSENKPYERLLLEYNVFGDLENGIETVYMDGDKICTEIQTEILVPNDKPEPCHVITILTPDYYITINRLLNIAQRCNNPFKKIEAPITIEEKQHLLHLVEKSFSPFLQSKMNETPVPEKKIMILGKQCDVLETPFFKEYSWHNIIMRREIKMPYHSTREIKSMEINPVIHPSVFQIPEGIFVRDISDSELTAMIDTLKKQIDESLKEKE